MFQVVGNPHKRQVEEGSRLFILDAVVQLAMYGVEVDVDYTILGGYI